MTSRGLRVAVGQSRVELDVAANGTEIRRLMADAAHASARVVHFCEGALSAYVGPWRAELAGWDVDWVGLGDELARVQATAAELGIWVVVGTNHPRPGASLPHNSVIVIDDAGTIVDRYDKRRLSAEEAERWYAPGRDPCVVEVDGIRLGLAVCIELEHPDLFDAYAADGVDAVLVSSFSDDPAFANHAARHAARTGRPVALAQPTRCAEAVPSGVVTPDEVWRRATTARSELVLADLAPAPRPTS